MNPRKTAAFLLPAVFVVATTTTLEASPQNHGRIAKKNVPYTLNEAQLAAQTAQMESAYKRLIEMNKRLAKLKKEAALRSSKAKAVKTAFKPSKPQAKKSYNKRLRVTATAYTSHVNQTDSTPNIAAWGDRLKPGMKVIAVSRDLLTEYGLKHRQKVRIKGLEGEYMVLDKMNKRWRKKIDIYMGMNIRKARKWGRRKVEIHWNS